jgi:hypothetical protein
VLVAPTLTASSTSSTSSASVSATCTADVTDGTTKQGVHAIRMILSCPTR